MATDTIIYRYAYNFGKPIIEPKPLVVKNINGRQYYWNFQKQAWVRLTRRCPLL